MHISKFEWRIYSLCVYFGSEKILKPFLIEKFHYDIYLYFVCCTRTYSNYDIFEIVDINMNRSNNKIYVHLIKWFFFKISFKKNWWKFWKNEKLKYLKMNMKMEDFKIIIKVYSYFLCVMKKYLHNWVEKLWKFWSNCTRFNQFLTCVKIFNVWYFYLKKM